MTARDRARAALSAIGARQSTPLPFQNLEALAAALEETDRWSVSEDEKVIRGVLAYNAWVDRDITAQMVVAEIAKELNALPPCAICGHYVANHSSYGCIIGDCRCSGEAERSRV